jgi:hypothetical protein
VKHKKILAVALACTLIAGCGVLAEIQRWEPVFSQAFGYVISILQEDGVIKIGQATTLTADAAVVTADFGELGSDITAAQASSSAATGSLNKTIAVLNSLKGDLGQLQGAIPNLSIPTMDVDDVQQSLGGLILALSAFQAQLTPVASLPPAQMKAALKKANLPKVEDFRRQFNLIQTTHGHADKQL